MIRRFPNNILSWKKTAMGLQLYTELNQQQVKREFNCSNETIANIHLHRVRSFCVIA